jgi:hypothetical protein
VTAQRGRALQDAANASASESTPGNITGSEANVGNATELVAAEGSGSWDGVSRGHVSLLSNSDTWHSKLVRGVWYL